MPQGVDILDIMDSYPTYLGRGYAQLHSLCIDSYTNLERYPIKSSGELTYFKKNHLCMSYGKIFCSIYS